MSLICFTDLYFTGEVTKAHSLVLSHTASKGGAGDLNWGPSL